MTNEQIVEKISNHDTRIKNLEKETASLESLTLSVQKLALSIEQMAKEQADYRYKQNEMAERLLTVEQQPLKDKANKHDVYMSQIITLVLGAIVGYLLKSLFGI